MPKSSREIPVAITQIMDMLARRNMRVGQMFENLFDYMRSMGTDPFYVENDKLVKWFYDYLHSVGINPFDKD